MTKPKPVNWELIDNDSEIYAMITNLVSQYHSGNLGLEDLNVLVMWRYNIKPDQDGYLLLADISKSSDKVRELRPHDVIIGINKMSWRLLNDQQKRCILDSQLERVVPCVDKENNHKEDDRSRPLYRLKRLEVLDDQIMIRRHNISAHQVQDFIINRLQGTYEQNSYVDNALN